MAACMSCKHFRRETENWELPDIWWYECKARPAMANLRSFPFANTSCKAFEARAPLTQSDVQELRAVLGEALARHRD